MDRLFRLGLLSALLLGAAGAPVYAQDTMRVAVTPFEFLETSDAVSGGRPTELEQQRLRAAEATVRNWFARQDGVELTSPPKVKDTRRLRGCDVCAFDLAQGVGADWITTGWVQKISELILNINLIVWDAGSEQRLASVSVDMRGNTDESWRRAAKRLLKNAHAQALGTALAAQAAATPPRSEQSP